MANQRKSDIVLFPVPRDMVEKLINLYGTIYNEDMKKETELKCDWCSKKNTDHRMKCDHCKEEFINCDMCWNHGRFHCIYPCMSWICQRCSETHLEEKHTN